MEAANTFIPALNLIQFPMVQLEKNGFLQWAFIDRGERRKKKIEIFLLFVIERIEVGCRNPERLSEWPATFTPTVRPDTHAAARRCKPAETDLSA